MRRIGVLALQGAFAEHCDILIKVGAEPIEIRQKSDYTKKQPDGLILPGGESTVIGKLLKELDLLDELKDSINNGLPVFGTCAGMILLAKKILPEHELHLGTMDIEVRRNAYGRQLGSFSTEAMFQGVGIVPMTFIRAPYIESIYPGVEVLATVDEHMVAARQKNMLVTSFHPELTKDDRIHRFFVENIG
ncbi:MAG: glutamine amidotransferase [Herbinix sp.]|jgi:5'-phosphate synthase pdxT subunit|nr:glutamine amidotransferase [Herbinix sp.]